MKTETIPNPISGIPQEFLVCPQCGARHFRLTLDVSSHREGHILAKCDCGYAMGFNYEEARHIVKTETPPVATRG